MKATDINSIQYCRNSLFAVYSGGSTSNYDYSGGGSLAIYDLEKNTLQKVEKTVLPTVNYTNTYGVDMKDYMRMQQLIIYGDPALNTLDYGRYPFNQPACQSLLRGSDWLLFFYLNLDGWINTVGHHTVEVFYVDRNRKLKKLGTFTEY
mgnify:CR=1 FL=1